MTVLVDEPPMAAVTRLRPEIKRTRVLIADPDGLARRMISTTLRATAGMSVIAGASDARQVRELTGHYRPDVLLLDTAIAAEGCCAALIRQLAEVSPQTRVLTMTAEEDDEVVLTALRAGAVGHVSKDLDPDGLAGLVGRVAAGEAIVPRGLVMALLGMVQEVPDAGWRPLHSRLTTREWEIVELLGDEASTEQIADALVLSVETVYSHVKSLLRKLGVTCRHDAVQAAQRLRHEEVLGRKLTTAAA